MDVRQGTPSNSPWEQFGFRNKFGNWGNTAIRRKESKKARRKRLKESAQIPQPRKKKKKELLKELLQSHMTENGIANNDAEAFGDGLRRKRTQTSRVALQNAHCFPEHSTHYKSRNIVTHLVENEYDVWMTCEVGLCWRKLLAADQWEERTFGKLHDSTSIFAYNTTDPNLKISSNMEALESSRPPKSNTASFREARILADWAVGRGYVPPEKKAIMSVTSPPIDHVSLEGLVLSSNNTYAPSARTKISVTLALLY
jgi:hypothetical protein